MKKTDEDRAARLAGALRANLRRRKAQTREQSIGPATLALPPDPASAAADASATEATS